MPATSAVFRFDSRRHEYIDPANGEQFPHITGMLEDAGEVDSEWFTEDSRIRGSAVHRMTADFDLGALDLETCVSRYKGWLLAHVYVMSVMRPDVLEVETPRVHPTFRYGGQPDRVWRYDGRLAIPEIKTGDYEESHLVQTALQAILVAPAYGIPPELFERYGVYLKESGRGKVERFDDPRDFDKARRIIKRCCHV